MCTSITHIMNVGKAEFKFALQPIKTRLEDMPGDCGAATAPCQLLGKRFTCGLCFQLWTYVQWPHKFPKQTRTIRWVFSLPDFTKGMVCQVLCSEGAQTTAQLQHEIVSGQDSPSPRALPTCLDVQPRERNPVKISLH